MNPMNRHKKIACFTFWFPSHNNPRYTALFPKLDSLVQFYKVTFSRQRLIRALQYRLWQALKKPLIYPIVLRYLARRYHTLFTVDMHQIPAWPRPKSVIVDADDPVYSSTEVRLLNLPQVKAIIVTTEKAKAIFQQLSVVNPIYVIPQGVSIDQIDLHKMRQIRTRFRRDTEIVVGYHAPTLTLSCDGPARARQGQDDLDFLFDAVKQAREMEPHITLWLFGEPSASVKKYTIGKSWIKLFGYVPFSDILNYVSNFDIGVYPRTWSPPPGRFSVKIAQFMACRVPIVSTRVDEAFIVQKARCGVVCDSQEDFSRALVELAQSPERRIELGNAGRMYAEANLDWSILVRRYEKILVEGP